MKKCSFCAEEIQDAAIVCKHCGRDLIATTPTAPPMMKAPHKSRWGRALLVVVVLLTAFVGTMYCGAEHQRFLAFEAQRDAWHRKCDRYLKTTSSDPDAQAALACNQELEELTAYAKRQGW